MKPATATWVSILLVAGAGGLAYTVNSALIGDPTGDRGGVETEAQPPAGTSTTGVDVDTNGQIAKNSTPEPVTTPEQEQTFNLGRLGRLTVTKAGGVLSVGSIESTWRTRVEQTRDGTSVYYTNGSERFRFDIVAGATGISGELATLAPPASDGSGQRVEDEHEDEEETEHEEAEREEAEHEEAEHEDGEEEMRDD